MEHTRQRQWNTQGKGSGTHKAKAVSYRRELSRPRRTAGRAVVRTAIRTTIHRRRHRSTPAVSPARLISANLRRCQPAGFCRRLCTQLRLRLRLRIFDKTDHTKRRCLEARDAAEAQQKGSALSEQGPYPAELRRRLARPVRSCVAGDRPCRAASRRSGFAGTRRPRTGLCGAGPSRPR